MLIKETGFFRTKRQIVTYLLKLALPFATTKTLLTWDTKMEKNAGADHLKIRMTNMVNHLVVRMAKVEVGQCLYMKCIVPPKVIVRNNLSVSFIIFLKFYSSPKSFKFK